MKTRNLPLVILALASSSLNILAQAPGIVTPPRDQTNAIGTTATFSVVATGTPPLSYQWRSYSSPTVFTNMPGQTNVTLVLTDVQTTRRYGVEVSNTSGAVTNQAVLRVGLPAGITQHPASATVEQGTPFSLSVVATGAPPVYQWYQDGVALPGQINSSIYFSSAQPSNAGVYRVTVQNPYAGTNLFGGPTSSNATVHVNLAPATFTRITNGPVVTDSARAWSGMWGDYDGDGWLDLVVEGDYLNSGRNTQFYHNEGGVFTRLTNSLVTNATDRVRYSPWVDLDNDGDLDIFMGTWEGQEPFVYRNQGSGVLTREAAPLNVPVRGSTLSWGDYDGDGFLDAFLGIHSSSYPVGRNSLLHGNGNGTFTVVTNQPMCLASPWEQTSSWVDYDNDGDLDLLAVREEFSATQLYRNDGNGQFTEVTSLGLPNAISGAWADFDNDGDLDLVIANRFYVNQGNGTFLPWTGQPATLTSSGLAAPIWGDYDNDGFLDLFTTTMNPQSWVHSGRLYRNLGDGSFVEIRNLAPVADLGTTFTAAWGDYNNDGFLDLFVAGFGYGPNRLYRNDGNTNHWLKIRLRGTASNSQAVGARVYATATIQGNRMRQMRQITAQSVIQELEAHFGLGDATKAEIVRVEWPSRRVTEWYNVAAGQILTLTEPTNDLPVITAPLRDQTNAIGTTATFEVAATGTPPLSFQWRSYSSGTVFTNMPGETNTILVLTDVQTTRRYGVEVSNTSGAVTNQAVLRVGFPAGITQHPASATVEQGAPFSLSVVATGAAPLYYQWYHDGVVVPGQINSSINFSSVQLSDAGLYRVTVQNAYAGTNLFGGPTSQEATVRVMTGVTFTKITNGPVATDSVAAWSGMWGDYDGDGWLDLVVEGAYRNADNRRSTEFYHNEGYGQFTRLTNNLITNGIDRVSHSPWVDLDNDGDLDIFMTAGGDTQEPFVCRNQGGGVFTREAAPLNVPARGGTIAWGDYDGDGLLDAFLGVGYGGRSSLLHNRGDGTFTVVTNQPMCLLSPFEESSSWVDYDNDGDLDLFSTSDLAGVGCRLYRNNGNGQFTEVTLSGMPNSISGAWADFDNDGDLDLVVGNRFYVNQGNGTFLPWTGQPATLTISWLDAPVWGDYDNDGFLDLFTTAMYSTSCRLFRNLGDGNFMEIRTLSPVTDSVSTRTAAWGDYDNDGFLDLFVATEGTGGQNRLYRNDTNSNHWLKIRLKGTASNSQAVGARVCATATIQGNRMRQMRQITAQSVIQELEAHFGLGDATNAEIVRVEWPSGQVTELQNVAARQILTVEEPNLVAGRHPSGVQLTLRGRIGSRYDVHTRASLDPTNNWSPWLSVTSTSPVMILTDTNVSGISQRYYKVVQPQR